MMKIVVLDGYTLLQQDLSAQALEALGDVTVYDSTYPEDVIARIGDAEIVLTNKVVLSRSVIQACPQLRYIGVLATGYNVVDLAAAAQYGVTVTNVPAYSTQAVAQHTIALLLHSMSRVGEYSALVRQGNWESSPHFCFFAGPMREIFGMTIGVVGFGSIGQAIARACLGLGMRVIVHTRTPKDGWPGVEFVSREALFARSDVISLHCPLTEQTKGMIDAGALHAMKDGVQIINTARGPLIDEAAMLQALESGKVSRYMADVLSVEPPADGNPLLRAPNTVITPHVAWGAQQTRARLLSIAADNIRAFLAGRPQNVVSNINP